MRSEPPPPAPPRSGTGVRRTIRGIRVLVIGVLLLTLAVVAVLVFLLQSAPGQAMVLRAALGQVDRFVVDGRVEVQALRSDGLLRGVTLHGVAIRDGRGRPFLEADSLRVAYSLRNLLTRHLVLAPVDVWQPRIVVETLHGDERPNVARIFVVEAPEEDPSPPAEPDPMPEEEPGFRVELRSVTVHGGEILLRSPVEGDPGERIRVDEVPGFEGLHQVIRFRDMEGRLERVQLMDPVGERVQVATLSFTGEVFQEPFRVEDFRGEARRVASRLEVEAEHLWFTGTELDGRVALDWSDPDGPMALELALDVDPLRLEDFRWIEPQIPEGEGRLSVAAGGSLTEGSWRVTDLDLRAGGSRVLGQVGFDLGSELRLAATDLQVAPLELSLLEPWLEEPLPVGGNVRGRARMAGTFRALQVDGELTYDDPGADVPPSTVQATGTLHLQEPFGVTGLSLLADPLRYGTLAALLPDFPIQGEGTLRLEATGSLPGGLSLTADAHHVFEGLESRVLALGSVRQVDGDLHLALDGNLEPLSLDALVRATPLDLAVEGDVRAQLRLEGPLRDLAVDGRVDTPGGVVTVWARTDIRDPAAGYMVDASTTGLDLTAFLPQLPSPSQLTGRVRFQGRGLELETVEGAGEAEVTESRIGEVLVDRATARLEARDGLLHVQEAEVESPLARLSAQGTLGLREPQPEVALDGLGEGVLEVVWEVEDLAAFRPLLMGDTLVVADTLTDLERQILIFDGLDPDALEENGAPPLSGSANGELRLRGSVPELTFDGWARMAGVTWSEARIEEGRLDFLGRASEREFRSVEAELDLDRPAWGRWSFQNVRGEVLYDPGVGAMGIHLLRGEGESYQVQGRFAHDPSGVDARIDVLEMNLDDVRWTLLRPTGIRVEGRRFQVDDLEIRRPDEGNGPVRIRVSGVLDLEGDTRLRAEAEGVDLARVGTIVQFEPFPAGILDLELDVDGPAASPVIDGRILVRDLAMEGMEVSRVEGTLEYRDRVARTLLGVEQDGRRLLRLAGAYPVDLAFTPVEDRLTEREVDLVLTVDSLPAATLLAMLEVLEDVEGVLDGEMEFQGPPRDLRPSGSLRLTGGALSLPELGFHPRDIRAEFNVEPDGVIRVTADARSAGTARVEGIVDLSDLTDPAFDLSIDASGFQAVARRDLEARIGGSVNLAGSYTRPRVTGDVRVEQGTMFLEEFARTAEVVDLTDPAFFDVVDTTLVMVRPLLEAAQNPFLQNLRVDVDLGIQRDFWLRSREMNVEILGNLIVAFDRARTELLLVGTLEANRGNYNAFGRQFQVRGGTVEFVGTPGVNPSLNIEAVNRLRREGGEPLEIVASVEGTLMNPRISLTSDAQPPIAQSDLISYLIFGRPAYALGSGETSVLEGAAGAGVSAVTGTIATQLSQVLARQIGLDFFTITQAQETDGAGLSPSLGGAFAGTQIEVGQYLRENLFLALVLRPLRGIGGTQAHLPGARLEWRFSDTWTMEGFAEDRFGRQGVFTFGEAGLRVNRIFGLELYREWGY